MWIVVFVAAAVGSVAVFAAEARAGSYDTTPPDAVLMKSSNVLQRQPLEYSEWNVYEDGEWVTYAIDSFDTTFPRADVVDAGRRLHVRLRKPQRPSVEIVAYPRLGNDGEPTGEWRKLEHTYRRVERDGKTVAWDVFFRVNQPDRHYYLIVHALWESVPGTHITYGDATYRLHVRTR